jgi:hypothetical protein
MSNNRHLTLIAITSLVVFSLLVLTYPALASLVTGGTPGRPPYAKLSVYQGVIALAPAGTNDSVMELGNAGRDIASTGDLFFRPSSLTYDVGIRLYNNAGSADMNVPGKVCLHPGGGAADCRTEWPTGGGSNLWDRIADAKAGHPDLGYLFPKQLNPPVNTLGVQIGSSGTPVQVGPATGPAADFTNTADSYYQAWMINTNTGVGALFQGNVYSKAEIFGSQRVCLGYLGAPEPGIPLKCGPGFYEAWHPADVINLGLKNEGINSGLDADLLGGLNVTIEPPTGCLALGFPNEGVHAACFCVDFPGVGKKCNDMRNRF